ncbi:hypothetical protein [Phenylobacterium sp. J367]|uniref:hypothetical protein n=1 Tax=Phenylobacterium sp. J367 TaxID=2898435 RepID=UPI002150F5E9|nr:hypothetical protein [Phenylobacterium sp. J367]MCR5880538.1 hypothetical protein [Phenylobacterium sp. J367]
MAEDGVGRGVEAVVAAAGPAAELDHVFHMVESMQVRPADPAGQRLHQHLAVDRREFGNLVADQPLVAPNDRSHGVLPL